MKFSIVVTFPLGKKAEVLESIKKLDYPRKEIEILALPGPGSPSIYRNKGGEKGKGEIIALIDDDAVVKKDLLKNAAKFFKKHKDIDIVGGPQLTPFDDRGFARISGYALSSRFGAWKTANRYDGKKLNLNADETMLTSANLFCRKKVMKKVKFDEKLWPGEDPKFIDEAKKKGFKVAYSPDLIVYHRRRPTIKSLAKQIFKYGRVGPLREKFSETLEKPSFLVPSIFVLYLLSLLVFIVIKIPYLNVLLIPGILYLSLDLAFSAYESIKNGDMAALFLLPFIFPLIHVSYGAGRIYGYLRVII